MVEYEVNQEMKVIILSKEDGQRRDNSKVREIFCVLLVFGL